MKKRKINFNISKRTFGLCLLSLLTFQILIITASVGIMPISRDDIVNPPSEPIIVYENPDEELPEELSEEEKIEYYESHFEPHVISNMPEGAYEEEYGNWKKGDPGAHTIDGDFFLSVLVWDFHVGQYDRTVDELVQDAIDNDCDFIGFTNIDAVRVSKMWIEIIIQLLGIPSWVLDILFSSEDFIEIATDLDEYYGAIQQARFDYRNEDILIFFGLEKSIGDGSTLSDEASMLNFGKRMQCLLPYNSYSEEQYMQELMLAAQDLNEVLTTMDSFRGDNFEGGSSMISPHMGTELVDPWDNEDFERLTQCDQTSTGVVSVAKDAIDDFIEYDPGASEINWDYCLDQGWNVFGAAGSQNCLDEACSPGETIKTYVKTWSPGYYGIMEGLKFGRVFSAQNDIIGSMDLQLYDAYDQIAYMGDTISSYGNQTFKFDVQNSTNIDHVNLITNHGGSTQIIKTFDEDDYDLSDPGHLKGIFQIPHSDDPYYARIEGVADNGDRFFSAPINYELSSVQFPEVHIVEPSIDDFHTNNASLMMEWTKSEEITHLTLYQWFDYRDPGPTIVDWDRAVQINEGTTWNNDDIAWLEDGWNTVLIKGRDSTSGYTARDYIHIYAHTDIPVVNILTPDDESYLNYNDIEIEWEGIPSGTHDILEYYVWNDTESKVTLGSGINTYTFNDMADGTHEIHVTANQTDNYETFTFNITIYVDTVDPTVNINNPPSDDLIYDENKEDPWLELDFNLDDVDLCTGDVDYAIIDTYIDTRNDGNYDLLKTETVDGEETEYNVTWADGSYLVNITAFDLANNNYTETIKYHIDFYKPLCWLPSAFYSGSQSLIVNWSQADTATEIDTPIITYYNETAVYLDSDQNGTEMWYPGEGAYPFTLDVNDTAGHSIQRESIVYIDQSNPTIFTVWIDDQYYGLGDYFKLGLSINDEMSGIDNVTLSYALFTDPESKYEKTMTTHGVKAHRILMEIPHKKISQHAPNNHVNVTFSFLVYDKVGNSASTAEFDYEIRLNIDLDGNNGLTVQQIFIIIGSVAAACAIGYYAYFKIKRKREFGDVAKYY
ncbi:MAG: hypothetical protein GF364_02810 [Candidatus Lokiarchaeota archaeon]|nr:hypothetical protein [Candidatus Lokiarchaeota archaeon]